jgi:hypothetical protein
VRFADECDGLEEFFGGRGVFMGDVCDVAESKFTLSAGLVSRKGHGTGTYNLPEQCLCLVIDSDIRWPLGRACA